MGLAGFGLEGLADVARGGSWHIGVVATPGAPEMLFAGRERDLLGSWTFPSMLAVTGAITAADVEEFARGCARPGGWRGATGLYRSMLGEGEELTRIALDRALHIPVLAVGSGGGSFTASTTSQVTHGDVRSVQLDGVGHYAALEAHDRLGPATLDFLSDVDRD